jgi:ankyrin repeat protein
MPSKRVALLFENFPSDYPVNLHRDYLRILNKLMRLWDTARFDHYMRELLISSRDARNGFTPEVVAELLFIDRLHEACIQKGIKLPVEFDWKNLPHNCYSSESFETLIRRAPLETISLCLDQNIPIDFRFNSGATPLIVAAEMGRFDVVEFLIESGANPNACNDHNYTALHWAAFHGHQGIVELLLKNGADPNIKDSTGSTPLVLAISKGDRKIAAELIYSGANIDKLKLIDIASKKGLADIVTILRMQPDTAPL